MLEMAKKSSRNGTRRVGFVGAVWNPFRHLFMASGESAQALGSTAGKIVKESIGAVEGVGSTFARHSNQAITNLTRGKRGRRASSSRKNTRRNRRNNSRRNNGSA